MKSKLNLVAVAFIVIIISAFTYKKDEVPINQFEGAWQLREVGKTYDIKYHVNGSALITKGSYDAPDQDGNVVKRNYTEIWTKVDFPKPKE